MSLKPRQNLLMYVSIILHAVATLIKAIAHRENYHVCGCSGFFCTLIYTVSL